MKLLKLFPVFLLIVLFPLQAQKIANPPVVGGVTATSASFVVRIDEQADVKIGLDVSAAFSNPIFTNAVTAKSDSDFFCLTFVTGLQPNTKYFYKVFINNTQATDSVERYFTTFPAAGEKTQFKFAFGSCQKQGQPGTIYNLIADENPVFFIQQGDWGYPDTTESPFSLNDDLVKESFRSRYSFTHPSWRLLRKTPIAYTYDDHDMAGNNVDGSLLYAQAALNMRIGYDKMFPHYPISNIQNGIWQKFSYANADLFLTDNRSQRNINLLAFKSVNDSLYFSPDSTHSILGEEQMSWLVDQLKNSTADWKFISSGTPFNPGMRSAIEIAMLLQNHPDYQAIPTLYGLFTIKDVAFELSDKWAGFPRDVFRLLKAIDENKIKNVIFLSGDTHTSGVDNGKNSLIPEIMAGPLEIANMGFVSLMQNFGVNIFNSGGHTSDLPPSEFGNAFGRVTVFNADSVLLEAVSENGKALGKTTVKNGYLPKTVAANASPEFINFDSVAVGAFKQSFFLICNNGIEDLIIDQINPTNGNISILSKPPPFTIKPFEKEIVGVNYAPHQIPTQTTYDEGFINISSNVVDGIPSIYVKGIPYEPNGIEEISGSISFELFQNYPNPFNPETKISYQIPTSPQTLLPTKERGFGEVVTLKVYDVLGNEVATLVNEYKQPGAYEVTFNSGNLSSGIYFYQLRVENFIETKKLVLMK